MRIETEPPAQHFFVLNSAFCVLRSLSLEFRKHSLRNLAATLLITLLFSCAPNRTPPRATPTAAPSPPLAATLTEARALRELGRSAEYHQSLRALSGSSDTRTAAHATALLGLLYLGERRWSEARTTLASAIERSPATAPFLLLRLAEAQTQMGDAAGAADSLSNVLQRAPHSSAATIARLRLPAAYARLGDRSATEARFDQAMELGIDELTEADFVELADALQTAGRNDLAARLRMRLLSEYPQGRLTESIYSALREKHPHLLDDLSLTAAVTLASKLARSDRYDQVLDLLERAGRHPDAKSDEAYRAARIRALFSSRNYSQLLEETATVKLRNPSLRLLQARAAWRANRPAEFLAGLAALEHDFPSSKEAAEAKVQRARYYIADAPDHALASSNLRDALSAGAIGNDGENLWALGWVYVLWGRDDEALRTFRAYTEQFPDGDYTSNALFWSGKIHQRHNRSAERDAAFGELIAKYPYSYFSYRAREILTGAGAALPPPAVEANRFPDIATLPPDPRLAIVDELQEINLYRDAAREMKVVAASWPNDLAVAFKLADVYSRGGEPFRANTVLQRRFREFVRHGGEGIPQRFWEILFPLNYWSVIQQEAQRRTLDPYLLASIVRQESGFEPHVVSNAGAVGLMQIMPQEAQKIAQSGGLGTVTREALFQPDINIAMGAAEYAQKLVSLQGNHTLAIAAYNAGEEAVGRWLARTPIDDIDRFIESIPYAETRLYVKTVTRNRFEYRRIYESRTMVPRRPAS